MLPLGEDSKCDAKSLLFWQRKVTDAGARDGRGHIIRLEDGYL